MEIAGYLTSLRRWWWTLLVATWVAALAGYIVASGLPKTYEAETRLLVGPFNTDLTTQKASGQLSQTYAELVTSQPLLESVIADLGLPLSARDLQKTVSASPNDVTRLLTIRVQDEDPERAAAIANGLARATDDLASGSSGVLRPEGEIQIIDVAAPPTTPVAPQVSLMVLMSAAAGLTAAVIIVLLIEQLGTVIRSTDDLAETSGLPVLAEIGRIGGAAHRAQDGINATRAAPAGAMGGAFRLLSARIVNGVGPMTARSVLIQATAADDGSAAFAADLAAALAERSGGVTLVTSSVDEPTDSVAGTTWVPDPGDGAGPSADVRRKLIQTSSVLLIHAPIVEASPAGLIWAPLVEAVVLVAARDVSERRAVAAAAESLRAMHAPLVGAVLLAPPAGPTLWHRLLALGRPRLAPDVAGEAD